MIPSTQKVAQCIFCQIPSNDVVIRDNDFEGIRCPNCRLIYLSLPPLPSDTLTRYDHGKAFLSPQAHISSRNARLLPARFTIAKIKRFVRVGDLLEIGAGAGAFIEIAKTSGFNPFAIELNPDQARYIIDRLGIPCETKPLSDRTLAGRHFDVIYHCDVLSHFPDPIAEFERIWKALKPGGILVFETGNLGDVETNRLRLVEHFQYPDHLFFFSERAIAQLLQVTGFEPVRTFRFAIWPEMLVRRWVNASFRERPSHANSKTAAEAAHQGRSRPSLGPLRTIYRWMMHVLRYRVGALLPKTGRPLTLIIVARKPRSHSSAS